MTITHADLTQFTCIDNWYRHPLVLYTDGVQYLAEKAEAYWLIDKIAAMQLDPRIKAEEFQVWKLKVNAGKAALLTATDGDKGNGPVILHKEFIAFTDFPLDEIELFVSWGNHHLSGEPPPTNIIETNDHLCSRGWRDDAAGSFPARALAEAIVLAGGRA
jgi:hypothetical protein